MRIMLAALLLAMASLLIWNAAAEADDAIAVAAFALGLPFLAVLGNRIDELWAAWLPVLPLTALALVGAADDNVPGTWGESWLLNLCLMAALNVGAIATGWGLRRRQAARP